MNQVESNLCLQLPKQPPQAAHVRYTPDKMSRDFSRNVVDRNIWPQWFAQIHFLSGNMNAVAPARKLRDEAVGNQAVAVRQVIRKQV